eukprot:TRINITY_DN54091_c0_g1_i1.p1 TRINITY_DN54091_c0_g1~~TRINITY_DN54091_c0_g1_i1.p1  ORF type:complete len:335 (-),score=46.57 TRINITY_DN54091_c0_g1_i1:44-1048(-)
MLTLASLSSLLRRFTLCISFMHLHVVDALQLQRGAGRAQCDLPLRDIFVVAGQSNAQGFGLVDELEKLRRSEFPSSMVAWANCDGPEMEYGNPDWRWRTFTAGAPAWAHGDEGGAGSPLLFGPEVAFGQELGQKVYGCGRDLLHESFGILKVAVSGTGLRHNWTAPAAKTTGDANINLTAASIGGATQDGAGDLYKFLLQRTKQTLASKECVGRCRVKALLWVQGEKDSNTEEDGRLYGQRLKDMVAAFREDLEQPDLPVLVAELGLEQNGEHPGADAVRAAQRNFVASQQSGHAVLVRGDGLQWMDKLHYNTAGQLELGRRFAEAYISSVLHG